MIMFIFVCILSIFLLPSIAEAWGPLTHVYLGYQVLDLGAAAVPVGLYSLIKKFKNDFLYGNLSADIIFGRRFQGLESNSHTWDMGWRLLDGADTEQQKAFAYGYLTHLCADTVVHNLDVSSIPFGHSLLEVKADSIVDKKYRGLLKSLDKIMQKRNDRFLEGMVESVFFSFKTNKRIFKGFLLLSKFPTYSPVSTFIHRSFPYEIPVVDIHRFRQESLSRMFELLANGENSKVLREDPLGKHRKIPLLLRYRYGRQGR